jgi:nicotinate phosphoribosyltransferase
MDKIKNLALLTDLYELTMAASYFEHGINDTATFSLFIRDYPPHRNYFVTAGLTDVLEYVSALKFSPDDLTYLDSLKMFKPKFLSYLENLRFSGDMFAIPEGRLFFANEPVLEVTAPMIEAQIIETFCINAINLQSLIATKASRCVQAAWPRKLVDFAFRRTHGIDAGMKVARASYIGGFIGTSNVRAGKHYDIPVFGTMAHSYVTSFDEEIDAFRAFVETSPENSILLIDTYDTLSGARKAAEVGKEMAARGESLQGVRLDSGNMAQLSRAVRKILKDAGLDNTQIFASGAFDEYKIKKVITEGADIDAFGVGTKMGVSGDAPYLDIVYKLVQYAGRPVLKLSSEKETLAFEKQVYRFQAEDGQLKKDVIGLREEEFPESESLLLKVMEQGHIISPPLPLPQIRETFTKEFARLADVYKSIEDAPTDYPVSLSPKLKTLQSDLTEEITQKELKS